MSSLLEGAKRLISRGSDIGARVGGLDVAVQAARGRLDDGLVDEATEVVERAAGRLRLSAVHTVVAIAGATGSGKSSTFNALAGLELSAVGVRRPTTSWATACVWGATSATELLEWLGIPARHQVSRDSMLDTGHETQELDGVVLLDLPDHDSTEVSHHLEVDRLVKLADVLVWVLDPQKYADAAVHDRYLKPYASYAGVLLVVLNHIDTVPEGRRDAMVADVRRLLEADGLGDVPVLPVSARNDWGIDELKAEIARRAASKKATRLRVEADVRLVATRLREASGTAKPRDLSRERIAELDDAFADAAGVPTVVAAVEKSTRLRANRATGWPATAWVSKLKPDPLKRLHLNLGDGRQGVDRDLAYVGPRADQGAAGARRPGRPPGSRGCVVGSGEAVGDGHPPRLGHPARGPQRPARPVPGCNRSRRGEASVVGVAGADPSMGADPECARGRCVAAGAVRHGLSEAARTPDPRAGRVPDPDDPARRWRRSWGSGWRCCAECSSG